MITIDQDVTWKKYNIIAYIVEMKGQYIYIL